jgi:hypothetical protein
MHGAYRLWHIYTFYYLLDILYSISKHENPLNCVYFIIVSVRKKIWEPPDEDGRIARMPTSIAQLLSKAKWEKPLVDWIVGTGVGFLG